MVLPHVPTRRVLVQRWYRLRSYQPGRVLDAGVYSLYQEGAWLCTIPDQQKLVFTLVQSGGIKSTQNPFIHRERERGREGWMDKESIEGEKDKTKHAHTQASK